MKKMLREIRKRLIEKEWILDKLQCQNGDKVI